MIRAIALAILLVAQDGVSLKYAADKGKKESVTHEITLQLKLEGTENALNFIRASSAFFSIQKIHAVNTGSYRVAEKNRHRIENQSAKVDGVYDDEKYAYEFKAGDTPEDLQDNKIKQLLWFLTIGGRSYTLEADGKYLSDDKNQEAWGEALDLFTLAVVRMPDKAVKEGETWTKEWRSTNKQKDNGGVFAFKQVSKIEKTDGKTATITSKLTGDVVDFKKDPNADKQGTKCDGTMKLVLDLETGRPVSYEASGKVISEFEGTDPNSGDTNKIKITASMDSKYTATK